MATVRQSVRPLLIFLIILALPMIDVLAQTAVSTKTVITSGAVNATTITVTRTVVKMSITTTTVPVTVTQTTRVTVYWGVDPNVALWVATVFAVITLVIGYILGYRVAKRGAAAK